MELTNLNKDMSVFNSEKDRLTTKRSQNYSTNGSINLPESAHKYIKLADEYKTLPFYEPTASCYLSAALLGIATLGIYPLTKMQVIPNDEIGLGEWGSDFTFLKPGRLILGHPTHRFRMSVKENAQLIQHGNFTRVRVQEGEYGYGINTKTGDPVILTPGTHIIDDPAFKWTGILNLSKSKVECGNFIFIRVETGKIGIAYINNILTILEPAIHMLKTPNRFHCFVSTQQQIIQISHKVESADYISINITADIFYYIRDPHLAFTKAYDSVEDLTTSIKETAIATISLIVRSSTFSEIGRGATAFPKDDVPSLSPPSYESYQKRLHDEFVEKLQQYMSNTYGIFIENIRIKSLSIHDQELAKQIAAPAIIYAQTQAKLANVTSQTEIMTAEAQRDAAVKKIEADTNLYSTVQQAEAKRKTIELETIAESNKIIALSKAKADAIVIEAEAEKRKLELEGDGNSIFAEKVGKTELGANLAVAKQQVAMMGGINKVVYAPTGSLPAIMLANLNEK